MARFCVTCGTPLVDETARFCTKCGAAVAAPNFWTRKRTLVTAAVVLSLWVLVTAVEAISNYQQQTVHEYYPTGNSATTPPASRSCRTTTTSDGICMDDLLDMSCRAGTHSEVGSDGSVHCVADPTHVVIDPSDR
jgi:zinc-ribbon domain